MGLAEIRTEIKNLLETVPGIGKIHDFERWTTDWKKFLSYFKDSDNKINGWVITRAESQEHRHATNAVNFSTHRFIIMGYYGLKDSQESEKAFQDLIEGVRSVLRTHDNLNGSCLTSDPPQVKVLSPHLFGGILTHQCEIQLRVKEYIQYTPA